MTHPPPTPQHHHDMLVDAITRGAASHTPAPHVAAAAAPPSSPVSALKRHSSHERDGAVSGVSSPAHKRTDARPTPKRHIRFDPNLPTPMQIESALILCPKFASASVDVIVFRIRIRHCANARRQAGQWSVFTG
eukprot:scaffold17649_cov40-Cyclotella_meneghiniana.AAC.2